MRRWFCRLGWHHFWYGYYGMTLGRCIHCLKTEADIAHAHEHRVWPDPRSQIAVSRPQGNEES